MHHRSPSTCWRTFPASLQRCLPCPQGSSRLKDKREKNIYICGYSHDRPNFMWLNQTTVYIFQGCIFNNKPSFFFFGKLSHWTWVESFLSIYWCSFFKLFFFYTFVIDTAPTFFCCKIANVFDVCMCLRMQILFNIKIDDCWYLSKFMFGEPLGDCLARSATAWDLISQQFWSKNPNQNRDVTKSVCLFHSPV